MNGLAIAGDIAAHTGETFGEGADNDITGTGHIVVLLKTASGLANDAESVGLITDECQVVLIGQATGIGQVANVAIHGVHTLDDQEFIGFRAVVLLQFLFQIFIVVVLKVHDLGSTELEARA